MAMFSNCDSYFPLYAHGIGAKVLASDRVTGTDVGARIPHDVIRLCLRCLFSAPAIDYSDSVDGIS